MASINLNQIPNTGKFQTVVDRINDNTAKLTDKITALDNATTKFKGYFTSLTALNTQFPSPNDGDTAWVGTTYPGTVYDVADGEWHDTTVSPDVPAADLSEYVSKDERMIINLDHEYPYGNGNYNLASAIVTIPSSSRKTGLTIQFRDADGNLLSYLFNGLVANFTNTSYWELVPNEAKLSELTHFRNGGVNISGINTGATDSITQEGEMFTIHYGMRVQYSSTLKTLLLGLVIYDTDGNFVIRIIDNKSGGDYAVPDSYVGYKVKFILAGYNNDDDSLSVNDLDSISLSIDGFPCKISPVNQISNDLSKHIDGIKSDLNINYKKLIGGYNFSLNDFDANLLKSWYWGQGCISTGIGSYEQIKQVVSCGIAQADIRAITYEDGSPFIENNKLYLSASGRTGSAGPLIFELDLGTYNLKLIGTIITSISNTALSYDNKVWHGGAAHILFDRNSAQWIISISGHRLSHLLYISKSYSDVRFGITHLDFSLLDYANATSGDEDPQIFYSDLLDKYVLVYASSYNDTSYYVEIQTSDYIDHGFSHIASIKGISATGITTTKVGGDWYTITGNSEDSNGINRYNIYQWRLTEGVLSLIDKGLLNIDYEDGGYRGWGSVIPVYKGDYTEYLFITFDRLRTENEDNWTYGNLYLYVSKQSNKGLEFQITNRGVIIPQSIVKTYGLEDLNFLRCGSRKSMLDKFISISEMVFDSNIEGDNSNLYPSIKDQLVTQQHRKWLQIGSSGDMVLVGGIHVPMSNYIMNLDHVLGRRYLYIGNPEDTSSIKLIVDKTNLGYKLSAVINNGKEHLIGYTQKNRILIALSSSILTSGADYIFAYEL